MSGLNLDKCCFCNCRDKRTWSSYVAGLARRRGSRSRTTESNFDCVFVVIHRFLDLFSLKILGPAVRPRFQERQLKGIYFIFCRGMFGNSRSGASGFGFGVLKKEVNYRQEEKKILDSVLGPEVYDKRIRPSGLNSTGKPPRLHALLLN